MSVAQRFLQDLDILPFEYKETVARFMSYAHTSVNSMSKVYLQNERRFNYTTPKSYLEQISLYGKLLTQKFSELHKKVSRLENGLDKLRSTAAQVSFASHLEKLIINMFKALLAMTQKFFSFLNIMHLVILGG